MAGLGHHHGGTGRGEIHPSPCDEDHVLMATVGDGPEDKAAVATWRSRRGDPDLLCDDDDGSRINRIGRLKRGAAPGRDRPPQGRAVRKRRRLGLESKPRRMIHEGEY